MERSGSCSWNLSYRRNFGEQEMVEWRELMSKLKRVMLEEEDDISMIQ
jgi:hypothetical protein